MPLKYDLHSHSTASDGTLQPADLLAHAATAGVDVLAVTDHDTVDGLGAAMSAAKLHDIRLIPGIELSVTWKAITVHIVGLEIQPENPLLVKGLEQQHAFRQWRAEAIGERLEKAGIPGAYEGAKALSNGHLISRTHFARFLVQHGAAKDMRDCFRHYLVNGKPGYVGGKWASLEQVLGWIKSAGGHAVIAHPARYRMTRTKLRKLIGEFSELGGDAIEVVSGSHSKDECFTMARHARDFELYASAGSDYHGPENPWIELGRLPQLPHGCKPVWDLFAA